MTNINIAIDGPAASGKTTLAKKLAKKINFNLLDTGLMYRSFTFFCLKNKINILDNHEIQNLLKKFNFELINNNVFINDKKIDHKSLISKNITDNINKISSLSFVRNKMITIQREIVKNKNFILVGRDIGTVVLPQAEVKIYLDADINIRAVRRLSEFNNKKIITNIDEVLNDLQIRDQKDKSRKIGALKKAEDAILLDTTNMNQKETIEYMIKILNSKGYK